MSEEIEKIRTKKMEELIRIQNNPKTKVQEFARAILECNEYKNFIKYNEELEGNQTAQNLLKSFQRKQRELQWSAFNPKTIEELRDLQMKIGQNNVIQAFAQSQKELVDLLKETNNLITRRIGMQFAFFQGGGCCG